MDDAGGLDVTTAWEDFGAVKAALVAAELIPEQGEVTMVASTVVMLDVAGAESLMALIDMLDDLDDVQNVFTNAEITQDVLAQL